jgi:urea transport system ATP-binding protein
MSGAVGLNADRVDVSEQVLSFALSIADCVLVIERGRFVHEALQDQVDEQITAHYLSV